MAMAMARPSPAPAGHSRARGCAPQVGGTNLHEASDCTVLGCDSTGRAYLSLGGGGPTSAVVVQEPLTGSNGGRGNGDSDLYRWYEYGRASGSGDASGDGTAGAADSTASAQGCELRALEKALRASGERRIADAIAALPPARPSGHAHERRGKAAARRVPAWLAVGRSRDVTEAGTPMWPLSASAQSCWVSSPSTLGLCLQASSRVLPWPSSWCRARSAAELAAAVPAVLVAIEPTSARAS